MIVGQQQEIKYILCLFSEGKFSPEIAKYAAMIKKAKYKEYQSRQKLYVTKLLKEILVNRQVSRSLFNEFYMQHFFFWK